ncbi:hypothetical protein [Streptomyces sp. NPDC002547]
MSPLRTLRKIVAPTGRHRAPRLVPERIEVPLDDLLGPDWRDRTVPYGAVVAQGWRYCEPCGDFTPGVFHKDGWTCGQCLTPQISGEVDS